MNTKKMKKRGKMMRGRLVAMVAVMGASGCGTSNDSDARSDDKPRYLVATNVETPEFAFGVVYLTDNIDSSETLDTSRGYELGLGAVYPIPGARGFLFASWDEPTVTRYEFDASGRLVAGEKTSAANFGWREVSVVHAVSETNIIVSGWGGVDFARLNAETMELSDLTTVEDLLSDPRYPDNSFRYPSVYRDGKIFVQALQRNADAGDASPDSIVIVLNPGDMSYGVLRDSRCSRGALSVVGDDILVGASDVFTVGHVIMGTPGFNPTCILRIPAGSAAFDPNYARPFSDWTGVGSLAAGLHPIRADLAYVRVYDRSLPPTVVEDNSSYAYSDSWRWAIFNPLSDEPARMLDGAPAQGPVERVHVEGEVWTGAYRDAAGTTTLVRLTENGLVPGITFTGDLNNILVLPEE
jgi:hypothetical protein